MLTNLNTRVLLSLAAIGVAGALIIGATIAFFSDTETSTGNVLAAGAIDLGIDNHSYYNGLLNPETTWRVDFDLSDQPPRQFFNFRDIKPGDWGEDTISLNVRNNESWLCVDVTLTSDDDNGLVDPEEDDGDTTPGIGEGELADAVRWYWWADDGDNVFECDAEGEDPSFPATECDPEGEGTEHLLPAGPMGLLDVGETATVALADSNTNIWTNLSDDPLDPEDVRFVGKAWCFGDTKMTPYPQDGGNQQSGPDDRPVECDGSGVNNVAQTDSFTADISFRAVQSRNNEDFVCRNPQATPSPTPSATPEASPEPTPEPSPQ